MAKSLSSAELFQQGLSLIQAHRLDEAGDVLRRAFKIDHRHDDARRLYAVVLTAQGRLEEALPLQEGLLRRHPGAVAVLESHALLLARLGRAAEAMECLAGALRQEPASPALLTQWVHLALALERYDEALTVAQRAIALAPQDPAAHAAYAVVAMLAGAYGHAFPHYAARHVLMAQAQPAVPWDGRPVAQRPLVVRHEQGFGDTLQMARFFPALADRAGAARIRVQAPLLRLLRRNFPALDLGAGLEGLDPQAPSAWLMDLPAHFAPTAAQVDGTPYLTADPAGIAAWRDRLGSGSPAAGLVWAGNPEHQNDRRRSLPATDAARLLDSPGVRWVSLQLPAGPAPGRLLDWTAELADFEDTAALIGALDLVVAVDTAVAHLAAALGKPTWILLSTPYDWRWGVEGITTPWYAAARLYRRGPAVPWTDVIARVRGDIEQRIWLT